MYMIKVILNNPNANDEILSKIAKIAVENKDEELMRKLATHPGARFRTLSILLDFFEEK